METLRHFVPHDLIIRRPSAVIQIDASYPAINNRVADNLMVLSLNVDAVSSAPRRSDISNHVSNATLE